MANLDREKIGMQKIGGMRRKAVNVAQDALVKTSYLAPGQTLPLVVQPALDGVSLNKWAADHREWIETNLINHGGILFRDFAVSGTDDFEQFMNVLTRDLLDYSYRSTPRTQVSGKIYTSTEYPADQHIPMHNEMSYSRSWPMKIWFYSIKVAEQGGETPISDSRKVLAGIDPAVRRRFAEQGVMYVRNYGAGIDLPWEEVFQTSSREEVEAFCRSNGIVFEWKDGNQLRTAQVCQAIATHPTTGEELWFNQAHLFHVSSLQPELRDSLLATLGEEKLPRNTYYGDGSPIEAEVLEQIRTAFDQATIRFPWQEGDILMLDNMLVAHGRAPFKGARKVVVGMAESIESEIQ